jgi:hypothetical protein
MRAQKNSTHNSSGCCSMKVRAADYLLMQVVTAENSVAHLASVAKPSVLLSEPQTVLLAKQVFAAFDSVTHLGAPPSACAAPPALHVAIWAAVGVGSAEHLLFASQGSPPPQPTNANETINPAIKFFIVSFLVAQQEIGSAACNPPSAVMKREKEKCHSLPCYLFKLYAHRHS